MEIKDRKALTDIWVSAAEKKSKTLVDMIGNFSKHAEIVLSDEVDSIAITRSEQRSLARVSRKFIKKYCTTPDDLLFLLLHELAHKFHRLPDDQGFDYLDPLPLPAGAAYETYRSISAKLDHYLIAMVEDIVVNARLCQRYFPHAAPFFLKLYDIKYFPDILMIPPVLVEEYRGLAMDFDPLYLAPNNSEELDYKNLPVMALYTMVLPALNKAKNWPKLHFDPKTTKLLNPEQEGSWVEGLGLWYWRAWSPLSSITLADLDLVLKEAIKELPTMPILGSHERNQCPSTRQYGGES